MKAPSLFDLACQQQRADAEAAVAARLRAGAAGIGSAAAVCDLLGTNGKSSDNREAKPSNLLTGRARRYRMLRQAAYLLPGENVAGCCSRLSDTNAHGEVSVVYREANKSVGFRGVVTCGSVWHCPVCANKIAEHRRVELATGMAMHQAMGGSVYMMTLTFPHTSSMDLRECIEGLRKALKTFKECAAYKRMKKATGFKGTVRALEVTHGENGWHPHTHELLFCDGANQELILAHLEELRPYWAKAVRKAGLGQINEHGFQVGGADKAADYVSKFGNVDEKDQWSAAHEMTRQHIKQGRKKGRTPFALLLDSMRGDDHASALFIEYANEFKGKRQLYYSPGLKKYLRLDEVDDAQIAAQHEEDQPEEEQQRVLYTLTWQEFQLLCRYNMRGEFLDVAAKHGTEGCYLFIKALLDRKRGINHTAETLILPPQGVTPCTQLIAQK